MHQELRQPDVICDEYDLQYTCITLSEIRWILRKVGRFTPYWMYFVLRVTTGMRPDEAVKLTLYNLSPDCRTITYRVDKASTKFSKDRGYVQKRKHRRVVLDPWVHRQLKSYLERTCRVVNGVFVSPYAGQKLFPWAKMNVVGAYWYKLRQQMVKANFDALRCIREFTTSKTRNKTYVVRPHNLRAFYASVQYYKFGMDLKAVMADIHHSDVETTNGYVHAAEALDATKEFLMAASWAEILGYHEDQDALLPGSAPSQTNLECF